MFPLVRRGVLGFVIAVVAMVCLDILGINISPLVAGLGIVGLAVALALQPTLANLFAGTYVVTEGLISVGDYVEMSNGIDGYVVDVSWRSTRLHTWTNNLVVAPNSLFAETIITNFSKPEDPRSPGALRAELCDGMVPDVPRSHRWAAAVERRYVQPAVRTVCGGRLGSV